MTRPSSRRFLQLCLAEGHVMNGLFELVDFISICYFTTRKIYGLLSKDLKNKLYFIKASVCGFL